MATTKKQFNPEDHMQDIKGKPYLPVQWRLVWFREDKPNWRIETEPVKIGNNFALFKAYIKDENGNTMSTAHKMETKSGFADFLEKAETGSIGRALAMCGYGTQFSPDLDEGQRLADSPVMDKKPAQANTATKTDTKTGGITVPQMKLIRSLYNDKNVNPDAMKQLLKLKMKVASHKDLTKEQASEWIEFLMGMTKAEEVVEDLDDIGDPEEVDFDSLDFNSIEGLEND